MPIASGLQPNIFRAISGSLFSSPVNWSRGIVPTGSDVAMIADNCTIDISRTLGSLVVRAPFTASVNNGITLNVSQSFLINGHINFLGFATVFLSGKYNEIVGMAPGLSTVIYRGDTEQLLPGGPYYNLQTSWYDGVRVIATTKKSTSNLVINGSLQINYGILELGKYDYYCSGSTNINGGLYGILSKNQPGNIIFNGALKNTAAGYPINLINFSNGNPNVEVRNGIDLYQYNILNTGKGTWRFTTNNQNIYNTAGASTITFDGPISIENINLSILANASTVTLNDVINGTTPTSQLITSGTINFNTLVSLNSMTTGSFNFTSSNNTIGFTGNYSTTIPSRFNVLRNAVVSGTGTKTLATSSIVSGSLSFGNAGTLELSSSNFTVSGSVTFSNNNSTLPMPLTKSGPGNVLFIGPFISQYINYTVDFSAGNPNVELRGGMNVNAIDQSRFKSGTGSWYFNGTQQIGQTIYGGTLQFDGPVLVGSGSVVGFTTPYVMIINTSSYIDGVAPSSKFVNSGSLYLYTSRSVMLTGSFDHLSNATSVIGYMFNGNYTLPYTTYQGLRIDGSGSKYTSGNTYLSQSYYGAGFGNLELGNYNFTISGSTTFSTNINSGTGSLTKSGSGTVIFGGLVRSDYQSYTIDFSVGNPTVEVRNGMELNSQDPLRFKAGSGSWYFTTNNQFFGNTAYGGNYVFSGSFIVGNDITLTHNGNAYNVYILGALNGSNANSKYYIAGSSNIVYYYNSQIPMQTGILDVTGSTTATFIYASGSQNVKGGIYRNLTFLNGLKTLQGNVSVLGTFSTGSGATSGSFNLNGFTLTNP